ncbi:MULTISPECIES: ABC transporter permease [Acidithrix]|uniref:ABC-2 family transporter protein n=1 Tax=Acidithrix ferrooxidans TaxID=1280514 RepID=A0A0D8HM38_9ACTN|nr:MULTISPECIES: ABC transporter permease [Acidithrix]KJF19075.1 ABC-2 family transporter protein [Acidithrix ferrooxidans]CAG4901657.1 unnamed protein product [Acidithrix sp. C25]
MFIEELRFILFRRRTLISFIVLAAIPIILGLVVATFGVGNGGNGPNPFIDQITHNGVFLSITAITTSQFVIIPLIISIVAGEAFASEAASGTLRYLLISPIRRSRILIIKSSAILTYALLASLFMVVIGLIVGALLFPIGAVTTLSGSQIPLSQGIIRVLGLGFFEGISVFSVVAIGVMASTLTDSAIGASAISFGFVVIVEILNTIPQLIHFAPIMLPNYWGAGTDLFRNPVIFSGIYKDFLEQLGWMALAFSIAWARFSTKDITS